MSGNLRNEFRVSAALAVFHGKETFVWKKITGFPHEKNCGTCSFSEVSFFQRQGRSPSFRSAVSGIPENRPTDF